MILTILYGFFLLIVLPLISISLGLALFLGIGWVLTNFLPFTLFEATLIGLLVAIPMLMFYFRIVATILGLRPFDWDNWYDENWDDEDWDDEDEWEETPQAYVVSPSKASQKSRRRSKKK